VLELQPLSVPLSEEEVDMPALMLESFLACALHLGGDHALTTDTLVELHVRSTLCGFPRGPCMGPLHSGPLVRSGGRMTGLDSLAASAIPSGA